MNVHNFQTMMIASSLMIMSTAVVAGQTGNAESQEAEEKQEKKKGEGFKGLIKKMNPVRLLMKLFKKEKHDSLDDEQEIEIN